jgi:hypothetical protein
MGHIRERDLKNGDVRYQAEIRLKGHPTRTAVFDRKTDAKNWIGTRWLEKKSGISYLMGRMLT